VATLQVTLTEGGIFDDSPPVPAGRPYGSIRVTFSDCNHGTVEFDLPEVREQGTIPMCSEQRRCDPEDG
jgi:hypothetical protein